MDFPGPRFGSHRVLLLRVGVQRNDNRRRPVDIGQKTVAYPWMPATPPRNRLTPGEPADSSLFDLRHTAWARFAVS
jgi:hypothetical protein